MFYSHEILTSRKHGVATVWLVATLGSQSGLKKVGRKAILDVDVPSACSTIVSQDEPLALRLQGSLLYGVSRVYSKQCGYVLSDTQVIRDRMRQAIALITAARDIGLDPKAGKARPDQLNVPEAETMMPDFILNFDPATLENFNLPESSLLSIPSNDSNRSPSLATPMLDLGNDSLSSGDGTFAHFGLSTGDSFHGPDSNTGRISLLDDPRQLLPTTLELDDGYNVLDVVDSTAFDVVMGLSGRGMEASIAGAGHTSRHEDPGVVDLDEGLLAFADDDEPFSRPPLAESDGSDAGRLASAVEEEAEEPTAIAEAKQRGQRQRQPFGVDDRPELSNDMLREWNNNYAENMRHSRDIKQQHKKFTLAKRNGAYFVFERGIGSVGIGLGQNKIAGPLAQFSGLELLDAILVIPRLKRKRTEVDNNENDDRRRVRARSAEAAVDASEQLGSLEKIMAEDSGIIAFDDEEIEVGRDAPSSLPDRRTSTLPWNVSASRHGSSRVASGPYGAASSQGGVRGGMNLASLPTMSRRASRMVSSSPLGGKGSSIGRMSQLDIPVHGRSSVDDQEYISEGLGSPSSTGHELPRMLVDSQAIVAALDAESNNFLAFVAAEIDDANEGLDDAEKSSETTFTRLLPPEAHDTDVAAQGFLHVLTLATKGLIDVHQEGEDGEIEITLVM